LWSIKVWGGGALALTRKKKERQDDLSALRAVKVEKVSVSTFTRERECGVGGKKQEMNGGRNAISSLYHLSDASLRGREAPPLY